jgi:PGDYG protein
LIRIESVNGYMPRRPAANTSELVRMILISAVMGLAGCGISKQTDKPMPKNNAAILQEIDGAGLWFHAKKTRPIWVRLLEQQETVKTLEGEEQVPAGNYLCRGEAGDIWPQKEERLKAKYTLTDEVDEQGWRKCLPNPDAAGVMAAQVPHAFQVQAAWGLLSGKPGDFIVKNYEDRANENPADVWIVDQALFEATYERVVP